MPRWLRIALNLTVFAGIVLAMWAYASGAKAVA